MVRSYAEISKALEQTPLFEHKTWRISSEPWSLNAEQVEELSNIGSYCAEFIQALERLYTRSWQDRKILRNRDLRVPWVAQYLDLGKPEELIRHARSEGLRGTQALVVRPDLLITENGFALTEIDNVPGGIGLTAYLNHIYGGEAAGIIGGDGMLDQFYAALKDLLPAKAAPLIAILVSDESATYRPEMEYVAQALRSKGHRVYCSHTSDLMPLGEAFCIDVDGSPEEVDLVYRFWELFDQVNVPVMSALMQAAEQGRIVVTAPMKAFQEEKLNLALLHHHLLTEYWRESLSKDTFQWLFKHVPHSWIMDPAPLPPGAVLGAPYIGGHPIHNWHQLVDASKKERDLIIKISGFDQNAWGARGVLLGSDASREEWQQGVEEAIATSKRVFHIVQEYRKPTRLHHTVYKDGSEEQYQMQGRVRLCPYYFVKDGKAALSGVLSTFCPADKKIIHGMRDAAMIPCKAG